MSTLGRGNSTGTLNRSGEAQPSTKHDTLLQKVGTMGRSKRKTKEEEEAAAVVNEGSKAVNASEEKRGQNISPEECFLEEGEERCMVAPETRDDPKVNETIRLLIDWINDEVADLRIVVKDVEEDLYDGQIIQKLIEKLSGVQIDFAEVTQSEDGQRQKLHYVLQFCDKLLAQPSWQKPRWTAESIHSKNLVSILHLLVSLALHYRAPIRFPEHCNVTVIVVQKKNGQLMTRHVIEEITTTQDELGLRGEKDAFDTLFAYGPEKLMVVKKSLITFVNKHLNKVNLEVTDLDTQFHDGVYFVILMGLLEGYFVPMYAYHLTPTTFEQKVHNVGFSFELIQDTGMAKPKSRCEDIVNKDLKCTLRVLYTLFTKYKTSQ